MEKIVNALLESIRALGVEAALAPQTVAASRPRVDLYFAGINPAGIDRNNPDAKNKGWERIIFNAEFKSEGTHSLWVTDLILAARKLLPLGEENMQLTFTDEKPRVHIQASWKRLQQGRFVYPDEEESSMPVRYIELWEVTVAYPAHIITGLKPEGENK